MDHVGVMAALVAVAVAAEAAAAEGMEECEKASTQPTDSHYTQPTTDPYYLQPTNQHLTQTTNQQQAGIIHPSNPFTRPEHTPPSHPHQTQPTHLQHTQTATEPASPRPGHMQGRRDRKHRKAQVTEEGTEEKHMMEESKRRIFQQLTVETQKWEEQLAMEGRWGHRKGTEKTQKETNETQKETHETLKERHETKTMLTMAKLLRIFLSEQSDDGLTIGNLTMFILGVFALTVGVVGIAAQFLKEDTAKRRVDLTAYGVPIPRFDEVAAVIHGGVDRGDNLYRYVEEPKGGKKEEETERK